MPVVTYLSPWPNDAALLNPIKWLGTQNLGAWTDSGYVVMGWLWNSSAIEATVGLRMASGHQGTGIPQTWEDMGVPSGQTVHGLRVTGTHHWYDLDNAATFLYTSIAFFGGSEILHNTVEPSSPTAFDTGYVNLGSISSSSSFRLQLISEVTAPDSIEVDVRYALTDLAFEIYYGACDLTVSPSSATVAPGGTQAFTASGGSTPVTWSTTAGSIDSDGLLTATMTPGTYSVTATSVWDDTCTDTVPVQVSGEPPPGGGRPRGFRKAFALIKPPARQRAIFTGHGFWGKPQPEPETHCAYWLAYFKGFVNAEDISGGAYGLPTTFEVCDLEDNHIYVFQKAAVDGHGWAQGRSALFKLERDATDTHDTTTKPQGLYAVEIIYDKA